MKSCTCGSQKRSNFSPGIIRLARRVRRQAPARKYSRESIVNFFKDCLSHFFLNVLKFTGRFVFPKKISRFHSKRELIC